MAEGAYKGGRKVYENGKELNTFLNDDSGVRFTPEALGESGGYRPIESDSSSYGRTVDEALGDKEPAQGAYEPEPEPQPREVNTGSEYDAEINQAAAEYGVDPVLAHAVAQAESQHGKSTSNVFGVDGVSDPHQSIRIGVKSLKRCIDDNGSDVRKGLREYNGSDAGGTPDYDDRVLNIANEYGGLGSAGGGAGGDAYSVGASAWMGARMPNGANGCVDAVVRIGSYYDPFLKDEADKGVASVPRLVDDARAAGKQVIDFDPNALEKGDTIVYGDNDHVVTYDGNGGYVGNSTGLGKVVHGGDYTQMGGLIEDAEGNTTRWTQSNNPQWYQDVYAKLGRAPKKSELPGIAEENLLKEQEFYERDQILNKLKDLREQLKKNPDADYESLLRGDGTPIGSSVKPIESEARLEEPPKSNEPANVEERSGDVRQPPQMPEPEIQKNIINGQKAIDVSIKYQHDVQHAMYREGIGDIDIYWGKPGNPAKDFKGGSGVSHIIAHRSAQGFDGKAIAREMPRVIMRGRVVNESPYKIVIEADGYRAVLAKNHEGKPSDPWLLTGFNIIKEAPSERGVVGGTSAPTAHTPTQTRRMGAGASSTSTIPQTEGNGAPSGKNNLVQNDAAPTRTNQAGLGVMEPGEPVPDANGNMPMATLPKAKSNGTYTGEVTRKGIFDRVRELFGTVRTGRVEDRRALGQYDRGTNAAAQLLIGKNATAVTEAINKLYGSACDKAVTLPQIIDHRGCSYTR